MVEQNRQLAIYQNFTDAHAGGDVSDDTLNRVKSPQIQRLLALASGVEASKAVTDRVTLVTILLDNSGSMEPNAAAVREGHSRILDRLAKHPKAREIWLSTQLLCPAEYRRDFGIRSLAPYRPTDDRPSQEVREQLSVGVLDPYGPLLDEKGQLRSTRLTTENYRAEGGSTPLYRRSEEVLLAVLGKAAEFGARTYKDVTSVTLIMSDGGENTHAEPADVAKRVDDLKGSGIHLVAAMGFGHNADFVSIFLGMHIDRQSILTTGSRPEDIDRALMGFGKVVEKAAATPITDFHLMLESGLKNGQ